MQIPYFHVDAFSDKLFAGNPAGVCLLKEWLPDAVLQAIAKENNLSETAFVLEDKRGWYIRWFTPEYEIDLCGHATLATAFVLFQEDDRLAAENQVCFNSRSGWLKVMRQGDLIVLDFPLREAKPCSVTDQIVAALGQEPEELLFARDLLAVFPSQDIVADLAPDFQLLAELDFMGVIVTAPGSEVDFVSRFFAPGIGVVEDPVTGSAHCTLIPYWARRLQKDKLLAHQISERGGELFCEKKGDRVFIGGRAVGYMRGEIRVLLPETSS